MPLLVKIRRSWHRGVLVVAALAFAAASPAAAQAAVVTEFPLTTGEHPGTPVAGPDGDVWFAISGTTPGIGRVTSNGSIAEFGSSDGLNPGADPTEIALGADGNLWFTDHGTTPAIGRITPAGNINEYPLAGPMGPQLIVAAPGGDLWFVDYEAGVASIARITPAGTITGFGASHGLNAGSEPNAMTLGPEGDMWFTDAGSTYAIGKVTPSGEITEYKTSPSTMPDDITAGVDGNLWFTSDFGPIGRITPSGAISEFSAGLQMNADPDAIAPGPEGDVWFDDQYANQRGIGKVSPEGKISEFTSGLSGGLPTGLAAGLDGNVWLLQEQHLPDAPQSVDEITPAGQITNITAGLIPDGGMDGDSIVQGPDGNLWFNDAVMPTGAIGKISLQIAPTASTGPASAITTQGAIVSGSVNPLGSETAVSFQYGITPALGSSAAAGTLAASGSPSAVSASLLGLPAGTLVYYRVVGTNVGGTAYGELRTFTTVPAPLPSKPEPPTSQSKITSKLGDQQITLTVPSATICVAQSSLLDAQLNSVAIRGSRARKLRFVTAAFYIDRGVRHTRRVFKRTRTGRRQVKVVYFTANTLVHRVPAAVELSLKGLGSATHTLTVKLSYHEITTSHNHRRTVTVTKSLTTKFRAC
jgi:streptogramin lyase